MWPSPNPFAIAPYQRSSGFASRDAMLSCPGFPRRSQNWAFPSNSHQSHRLLYVFLPGLVQAAYQWNTTPEDVSHELVCQSSDIEENGSFLGMRANDLESAYLILIQLTQERASLQSISTHILDSYTDTLQEDEYSSLRHGRPHYRQTLLIFRAHAEISRQTRSRHLADILCRFFQDNVRSISLNSIRDLVVWCISIHRSHMHPEEKRACLAPIVEHRPEIISELRTNRTYYGDSLWSTLVALADELGSGNLRVRGRSRDRWGGRDRGVVLPTNHRGLRRDWGSVESSPVRHGVADRDLFRPRSNMVVRSRSAPSHRSIAMQAGRVIDLAENTVEEAARLQEMI